MNVAYGSIFTLDRLNIISAYWSRLSCPFVKILAIQSSYRISVMYLWIERLFVRVNHKNELYFSIISFQNEVNKVYVSGVNIVVFQQESWYFRFNKWNIRSTNCNKTYDIKVAKQNKKENREEL